jgi:hypothetical protein
MSTANSVAPILKSILSLPDMRLSGGQGRPAQARRKAPMGGERIEPA